MIKVILKERKSGSIGLYKLEMKYLGTIVGFNDGYTGFLCNEGENVIFKGEKDKEVSIKKVRDYFKDKEDWEI